MIAAVHFPDAVTAPDALFWADENGALRAEVAETTPSLAGAWTVLTSKDPDRTWEEMFRSLAERNPAPEVWQWVELEDSSPAELLEMLRRQA